MEEVFRRYDEQTIKTIQNRITGTRHQQECAVAQLTQGYCFRIGITATVLLYFILFLYLVEWKYPKQVQLTPQERIQRYRLMSHISRHSVFL